MPKWWEKTVEYLYLAEKIESGLSIVLPFAGPLERELGDALTIEADSFEIVEFKLDSSDTCLATENVKYGDGKAPFTTYFSQIEEGLADLSYPTMCLPHSFVCGTEVEGYFQLDQFGYWNIEHYSSGSVGPAEFQLYTRCLAEVRRPSGNGKASGGLVVGICTQKKEMVLIELDQLLLEVRNGMKFSVQRPEPPEDDAVLELII